MTRKTGDERMRGRKNRHRLNVYQRIKAVVLPGGGGDSDASLS